MFTENYINNIKSKEEVLSIISSNEFKKVFTNKNINNVIIFGSLSKDNFSIESDVDIAIISEKKLSIMDELNITAKLEDILERSIDLIDINDDNINNFIKIEALNSKLVVIQDELLESTIEYYDRFYKENEEFWYLLDKEVLSNE